ncbi:MAG: shikimate dehydrogenase [Eubacteriales bacterium]|nr:shikimate dehydrogenase [Eubacteriales bacterium]
MNEQRYAVFGHPIEHSLSPCIHTLFAEQEGRPIEYDKILVPQNGFAQSLRAFADRGGVGANVTVPFKIEASTLVDEQSNVAARAGAVNTLIRLPDAEDGRIRWSGDNTDGIGLVADIARLDCAIQNRSILIIGAGGAARGVLPSLIDCHPSRIVIVNRTHKKAYDLAKLFGLESFHLDTMDFSADIVINATSASLHQESMKLPKKIFQSAQLAYDMVYAAEDTPFIKEAKAQGVPNTSDGLGMLVEQAAESYRLWRGFTPERKSVLRYMRETIIMRSQKRTT